MITHTAFLARYLDTYGYAALFAIVFVEGFGLPAPGQTFIMAAAALSARGEMHLAPVLLISWCAAVLGDNLGFLIGRIWGRRGVQRLTEHTRLLHQADLDRAEHFFSRHGGTVVAVARFIDGLRQINGIVAATSGMGWGRFLAYNALGAALWVGIWGGGVYLFGNDFAALAHHFKRFALGLTSLLVIGLVWLLLNRRFRR